MPKISPHAIVECPANLADDVVVGAFCCIGPDVRIGARTQIDNNVTLDGNVRIGEDCHVYPFAVIGQVAGDGAAAGPIVVGDHSKIREHAVICGGAAGETTIGSDTLVMTGCYVGPDVRVGDNVVLGNYCQFADRTCVESHVWAAAFTGTREGITIGKYSFTSGYAGIDRDAPPFAVLQGYPFRIRGVNVLNLRRCGLAEEEISQLKEVFRDLFDDTGTRATDDALAALAARDDLSGHLQYLANYLRDHNPTADSAAASLGSGKGI